MAYLRRIVACADRETREVCRPGTGLLHHAVHLVERQRERPWRRRPHMVLSTLDGNVQPGKHVRRSSVASCRTSFDEDAATASYPDRCVCFAAPEGRTVAYSRVIERQVLPGMGSLCADLWQLTT